VTSVISFHAACESSPSLSLSSSDPLGGKVIKPWYPAGAVGPTGYMAAGVVCISEHTE